LIVVFVEETSSDSIQAEPDKTMTIVIENIISTFTPITSINCRPELVWAHVRCSIEFFPQPIPIILAVPSDSFTSLNSSQAKFEQVRVQEEARVRNSFRMMTLNFIDGIKKKLDARLQDGISKITDSDAKSESHNSEINN
jgi:hypothetical protein